MPAAVIYADLATQFVEALGRLEAEDDSEALVALFAPDASLETPASVRPLRTCDDIREFWRHYRHAFKAVHTDFIRIFREGDDICLEWQARVEPRGDHAPVDYRGVTLLRLAGGRIREMRSYFDTRPFTPLGIAPCR